MKQLLSYLATILFLVLLFGTCAQDQGEVYTPIGLRKLTPGEIIERITNKTMTRPSVVRDAQGNEITMEEMIAYDKDEYFHDMYVDGNGILKEVVIRKATKEDKEVMKRIEQATEDLKKVID